MDQWSEVSTAATIEAVADDVKSFAVGDAVLTMVWFPEDLRIGSGGYAQFIPVAADKLAANHARSITLTLRPRRCRCGPRGSS